MNRNTKLKPLAPRPVMDQTRQQSIAYSSCASFATDGRNGTVNRNAFVGANLGVHASPLEAVTSMDPKDYVWGGGHYSSSFYGCSNSAFAGAQPCYYPPACEYPVSHAQCGYADQYQSLPSMPQCGIPPPGMMYTGSAADCSRGDLSGTVLNLCDTQTSDTEDLQPAAPLDSKVDDLLDLDDESLKQMLSPGSLAEAAVITEADELGRRKKPRHLESMPSGDSQASGSEEVILPDFGEGFGNSDGMLLDVAGTSPLSCESGISEVNPYLSPLLDPPTLATPVTMTHMGSSMLQSGRDRPQALQKREAVADLLSNMSMVDAVQCITNFLRCDKRIADDKRQAAATAVQGICSSKPSLVLTLRQPSITLKPQLKRKRSSSKALEAARISA